MLNAQHKEGNAAACHHSVSYHFALRAAMVALSSRCTFFVGIAECV
jgi:hypothetical protein